MYRINSILKSYEKTTKIHHERKHSKFTSIPNRISHLWKHVRLFERIRILLGIYMYATLRVDRNLWVSWLVDFLVFVLVQCRSRTFLGPQMLVIIISHWHWSVTGFLSDKLLIHTCQIQPSSGRSTQGMVREKNLQIPPPCTTWRRLVKADGHRLGRRHLSGLENLLGRK